MIPVCQPVFGTREKELLKECIDTQWISSDGPFVAQFEKQFSNYVSCENGIAVANGTAALEVALYAIGIGEGDEVILPSFTIISCALAILRLGARPVFVDCEPETWNIDTNQVEKHISPKTKAIMAVHMYGHPSDMDPLLELKKKYKLSIIEDCAQVHGAEYKGRRCGSIGDVASFSFYSNKIITTGEGGMVTTNHKNVAERARSYRNLCFTTGRRFLHEELGYNFRMTNLQAAIGVAQMERIDEFVQKKRELGQYYTKLLQKIPGVKTQIEKTWAKCVYWMYCVELDPKLGIRAHQMIEKLGAEGIQCRPFFYGLHDQPALRKLGYSFDKNNFAVTERAAEYGFYLPSSTDLPFATVDHIVTVLAKILKEFSVTKGTYV